jgi:hypothetical protein
LTTSVNFQLNAPGLIERFLACGDRHQNALLKFSSTIVYELGMESGHHYDALTSSEQRRETMPENAYNPVTEPQNIPDNLKVPDGNVLLLRAYGKGVQKYA